MASKTLTTGLTPNKVVSFATALDGVLYMANGTDRPIRWDGETASAEDAGLLPPGGSGNVAATGSGTIYGDYECYVRYIDNAGIPSNFTTIAATVSVAATSPVSTFSYSALPSPSDARAVSREVWRNTRGQTSTFYLDTTATGATATSLRTDGELRQQTAMRLYTDDGWPNARRHGVQPAFMKVVASFRDRMWYCAANVAHADCTEADRNHIYFSEAGEPEAFAKDDDGNHVNVLGLQVDGDYIVGAMPLYSYLYILKERHIYRLSTAGDPRNDVGVALVAERGVLNNQCWCRVQGLSYIMDAHGIYRFDGMRTDEQFTGAVQDYFRGKVDFSKSETFHVGHDPGEGVVRFFVVTDVGNAPRAALCYNYLTEQWWEETYDFEIRANCNAKLSGNYRLICGALGTNADSPNRRWPVVMNEGQCDGFGRHTGDDREWTPHYPTDPRTYGTITAVASSTSFSDANGNFDFSTWYSTPATMGCQVRILDDTGEVVGSSAIKSMNVTTTSIGLWTAIDNMAVGNRYILGGIPWEAKFGTFRYLPVDGSNPRRISVTFDPSSVAAGTLNISKYHDHNSSADTAAMDYDDNVGVSVTRDSANVVLDQTESRGQLTHNFDAGFEGGSPANRMVEVEVHGIAAEHRTKIYETIVDGVH